MARRRRHRDPVPVTPEVPHEPEVTLEAVYGPDELPGLLAKHVTLEETIIEVVEGARQTKRDNYKQWALTTLMGWQGVNPAAKTDLTVGTKGALVISWADETPKS